MFDNARRR